MKLERFKERDNKKIGVIVFTLVCLFLISGAVLYRTFAIFEVKTNQNVIKGKVGDMGDLEFAFYIDDKIVKESPKEIEKEKYIFDEESSSCTNDAKVYWDYQKWAPYILNLNNTKTKCYLKFKTEYSEALLNGAVPKLEGDLTPVKIDENGTVRKADIKEEWYNYGNQQWANAVITENSYELLGNNVYGAKKENGYVHLDGVDDYIDLGLANYNFSEGLTLVLNAKLYNNSGDSNFGNWESGGGGLGIGTNVIFFQQHINGGYKTVTFSNDAFEVNNYHVIIGTYDNEKIQLIIDGEVKATLDVQGTIKPSSLSIILGGNPNKNGNPPSNFSQMDIKQAAIFNRAISEEEFKAVSTDNFKITNSNGLLKYVDFTNKTYENNEVISEDNIESYFVWIPRYRYLLWNGEEEISKFTSVVENLGVITDATKEAKLNQQQPIRIEFESKNIPISQSTEKGEYLTHPAFTSFESNGFWVGKFETGYKGATSTTEAQVNEKNTSKVIIKPNVYSWRYINISNAFETSKEYKQNLDSHMMKNMEWGAIAYLTNSKYGRCKNNECEEVRINNSQSYVTGSSAVSSPICGYADQNNGTNMPCNRYGESIPEVDNEITLNYKNKTSNLSSTTGNYYGIYDMSGGAWESVMGVMKDSNENLSVGNSGFTNFPEAKYYDSYDYSESNQNYNRGRLGDGTKEFGPFYSGNYGGIDRQLGSWYSDGSFFVFTKGHWFRRGAGYQDGADSGITNFSTNEGQKDNFVTFRIVLTP